MKLKWQRFWEKRAYNYANLRVSFLDWAKELAQQEEQTKMTKRLMKMCLMSAHIFSRYLMIALVMMGREKFESGLEADS